MSEEQIPGPSPKILIVAVQSVMRKHIELLLRDERIDADVTARIDDGLSLSMERTYDVILLHSAGDFYESVSALERLRGLQSTAKIVMTIAYRSTEGIYDGIGVDHFVPAQPLKGIGQLTRDLLQNKPVSTFARHELADDRWIEWSPE